MVTGVEADQLGSDDRIDIFNRHEYAFAEVAFFRVGSFGELIYGQAAVAKFDCFVYAGGSAGRHCGTTDDSGVEFNVDFNSRVTTGVDDFSCAYISDVGAHIKYKIVSLVFSLDVKEEMRVWVLSSRQGGQFAVRVW